MDTAKTRQFGPFLNVPTEDIKLAGFKCRDCRQPVERLTKVFPPHCMVPRMFFYGCHCGTIVVWEDEVQPRGAGHWRLNIDLLKRTGSKVLVFNGAREHSPGFSGIN